MGQCDMELLVEEVMKFHGTSILKGNPVKKQPMTWLQRKILHSVNVLAWS